MFFSETLCRYSISISGPLHSSSVWRWYHCITLIDITVKTKDTSSQGDNSRSTAFDSHTKEAERQDDVAAKWNKLSLPGTAAEHGACAISVSRTDSFIWRHQSSDQDTGVLCWDQRQRDAVQQEAHRLSTDLTQCFVKHNLTDCSCRLFYEITSSALRSSPTVHGAHSVLREAQLNWLFL